MKSRFLSIRIFTTYSLPVCLLQFMIFVNEIGVAI